MVPMRVLEEGHRLDGPVGPDRERPALVTDL